MLKNYAKYLDKKYKSQKLNALKYYWEMYDEDIIKNVKGLYIEFEEADGKGFSYQLLVNLLFELKDIGLEPVDINCFKKIMKDHIENDDMKDSIARKFSFTNKDLSKQCTEAIEELRGLSPVKNDDTSELILADILKSGNRWGNKFYTYCYENGYSLFNDGFFKHINLDELIKVLETASVQYISDFRRTLPNIYAKLKFDYDHQGEILILENFLMRLNGNFIGQMRRYNIMLLKQRIEEFKNQISLNDVKSC